ncbi:MAG: NAD(P)-dependent dehydrogenase (short-subunit alcohol dehydrogenase family), partial [Alphaproteobacteria bacterium]
MNLDDADDLGLTDKVAIVSGGGALDDGVGNGRAAALLLARSGARVLLVDRNLEAAEGTVALIKKDGGATSAFAADVTNEDDCRNMVDAAMTQFGRLDFLDNNVGIGSRGAVVDEALETYRKVMRVNVESMFLTSKYAIPVMIASGGGGAIVNISSISALRPRGLTTYSVSKGAVITLSKAMAVDHGPDGIRVNCVAPGPVYTPMVYAHGMSESARGQR